MCLTSRRPGGPDIELVAKKSVIWENLVYKDDVSQKVIVLNITTQLFIIVTIKNYTDCFFKASITNILMSSQAATKYYSPVFFDMT